MTIDVLTRRSKAPIPAPSCAADRDASAGEFYAPRTRAPHTPRVLICAADVGCGHARAAHAVALAMRSAVPGLQARTVDALEYAPRWFTRIYRDAYLTLAKHLPRVTGWIYDKTDTRGITPCTDPTADLEARAMRGFCASEAVVRADLIVTTHFLCARVLSREKAAGRLRVPLVVVVTDQHPHACWRVPQADLYLVASEAAAEEMRRNDIPRDKVRVTGIPIDARFEVPLSRAAARRKLELPADARIALIAGGGLGLGGIDRAFEACLRESSADATTRPFPIVVCGRNESLFRELVARHGESGPRHRIIGLTQRMHELMAASDVFVGKPGGLTTSEATAMALPMVLLRPLPGQEERNAEVLTRAGTATLCRDPAVAGRAAAELLGDTARLAKMSAAASAFGRPRSAQEAAHLALGLVSSHRS